MPERTDSYTVLRQGVEVVTELDRKRSRFLTVLGRAESQEHAAEVISQLRQDHPTARHCCSAWVIGFDRDLQRAQDDGEPSGTAGAPILAALLKTEMPEPGQRLSDVVAVVLRWFGGTLLGSGGLVSAYSDSVTSAIEAAKEQKVLRSRVRMQHLTLDAPVAEAGRWENDLRAADVQIAGTDYSADGLISTIHLAVPNSRANLEHLQRRVASLSSGTAAAQHRGMSWQDR